MIDSNEPTDEPMGKTTPGMKMNPLIYLTLTERIEGLKQKLEGMDSHKNSDDPTIGLIYNSIVMGTVVSMEAIMLVCIEMMSQAAIDESMSADEMADFFELKMAEAINRGTEQLKEAHDSRPKAPSRKWPI